MYEIDRLKKKARAGETLTAREGLWLVEKVNQLREALAFNQGNMPDHPAVRKMGRDRAEAAQLACCWDGVTPEPQRGNQEWAEWGLNAPPDVWHHICPGAHGQEVKVTDQAFCSWCDRTREQIEAEAQRNTEG